MQERDRLIELLDNFGDDISLCDCCKRPSEDCDGCKNQQLAEHLLSNGVTVPPCKVGDEIWVIDREDGEAVDISCVQFLAKSKDCIIATSWINDYDLDETLEYHINETQNNFDTDLKVYPDEDCFLTKEEAEKALKEREG